MYKKYWENTQKWKIIKIMILKWPDKFYQDFELEKYNLWFLKWEIFVWNNSWPRLSQLLKDWVVEVEYFENPKTFITYFWNKEKHCYHRAKYKLKPEAVSFYKEIYNF